MSTNLTTVLGDEKLNNIVALFEKNHFHHLPVVEPSGKVIGIVSQDDIRKISSYIENETTGKTLTSHFFHSWTAKRIMTPKPICLEAHDSLAKAANILLENHFHALPVVENNRLIGLVTSHDLLRYAYAAVVRI